MHFHNHGAIRVSSTAAASIVLKDVADAWPRSMERPLLTGPPPTRRAGRRLRLPWRIQFAEALLTPQGANRHCPSHLDRAERGPDPGLGGLGTGIQMHTDVVHQQAERRLLRAFADRAKEAVLEMPTRHVPTLPKPLHTCSTGPSSPGKQRRDGHADKPFDRQPGLKAPAGTAEERWVNIPVIGTPSFRASGMVIDRCGSRTEPIESSPITAIGSMHQSDDSAWP